MNKLLATVRAWFAPPSAKVIAATTLEAHERMLLEAKKDLCWADKRVKFHIEQIAELNVYLKEQ